MHVVVKVVVAAVVGAGLLLTPTLANAGSPGIGGATLNVTKIVTGDVPPGTTFTVLVHCPFIDSGPPIDSTAVDQANGDDWGGSPEGPGADRDTTLTFDETGGTQSVDVFFANRNCTVTETDDGGASSVTYGGESEPPICEITPSEDNVQANFDEPDECEVTITNAFPEAEAEPAAEAVEAQPAFTG